MAESQRELILRYMYAHPRQDLEMGPIVDWVTDIWLTNHKEPPRDIWRAIRKLHQEGILIKVKKGIYKFDPDAVKEAELWDFTPEVKRQALVRDHYACVVCGRTENDGVELTIDHRKPKDLGGDNSLDNAQTLCTQHNLLKKNYNATTAGKRYFVLMYEEAIKNNDLKMVAFCKAVFDIYDEYEMNGHIDRPDML